MNKKIQILAGQYKEFRMRRGRLAQGEYDKDLSDFGGAMQNVMASLGTELGHAPYTKYGIMGCLGDPDAVKNDQQMGNYLDIYNREQQKAGRVLKKNGKREYLIYFWRGWHDFLFFVSENGKIVDHGWWYALDR